MYNGEYLHSPEINEHGGTIGKEKTMKKNRLDVKKSVVVLAMLIPAVALANSHDGYTFVTVTPTTVAPGYSVTIELEYTVTISDGAANTSLWEVYFDGVNGDRSAGILLASDTPPVNTGTPIAPASTTITLTGANAIVVQIPETTLPGQYPLNIFSCAASYQPVAAFSWYVEQPSGQPIQISVEEDDPVVLVQDLIDTVEAMNLQQGIENSLDAKLDAALNALDDLNENNDVAAINSLESFINAVEAQRGKKITNEQADILVEDATYIISLMSPE